MKLPKLAATKRSTSGIYKYETRDMVESFNGYDHNYRISDKSMYDMENLTCDRYPLLSQRKKRATLSGEFLANGGIFASDNFYYINGTTLYKNGVAVKTDLSDNHIGKQRQFAQLGAKLCIFPDKIIYNTEETNVAKQFKYMDNVVSVTGNATITLCDTDGTALENVTVSPSAPSELSDKKYWMDTSETPHILKQYSAVEERWISVPTTYVKVAMTGIGQGFNDDDNQDAVSISGFETYTDLNTKDKTYKILHKVADDKSYFIMTGIIDDGTSTSATETGVTITLKRESPEFVMEDGDYITSLNNRIWMCSSKNHEVYACKLGDPTNWRVYQGIASDSYAATVGSPGKFTGATTLGSYVLFFKENTMHKLYGTKPSNYTFTEISCRGIMDGSWRSAVVVNESLIYLSREGVMKYTGSLPTSLNDVFAEDKYTGGVAGTYDNKYYISMQNKDDGYYTMFVYDLEKKLWCKEDDIKVERFASYEGDLYFTMEAAAGHIIKNIDGTIDNFGRENNAGLESYLPWMAESGYFGLSLPDQKWLSKLVLRIDLEFPSTFRLYISYDDGEYELQEDMKVAEGLNSYQVPIIPRRCDHFRIKIMGEGGVKLYSISKILWQGSEIRQ